MFLARIFRGLMFAEVLGNFYTTPRIIDSDVNVLQYDNFDSCQCATDICIVCVNKQNRA